MKYKVLSNNNKYNTLETIRLVIKPLVVILCVVFIIQLYINSMDAEKVPVAASGKVVVFHEEFSKHANISKIEANEDYIFILYSNLHAVAIYDMNGVYQQSLAFPDIPNAVLQMRYDNGLLYVTIARYLYIFENCTLLDSYEQTGPLLQPLEWFIESGDIPITISNGNIYNLNGDVIMPLPGKI